MIFYMTSATVSDKTILQIDADSLLFFNCLYFQKADFSLWFLSKLEIFKILKNQPVGPGQRPGGRRPRKLLHFSNWKVWYAFRSVYPTWFVRLNDLLTSIIIFWAKLFYSNFIMFQSPNNSGMD